MSKNEIAVPRKLIYAIAIGAVLIGSVISVCWKHLRLAARLGRDNAR